MPDKRKWRWRGDAAMKSTKHVVAAVAMLSLAATSLTLVASSSAYAAAPKMAASGRLRDCINTSLSGCANRGTAKSGSAVTMHCWQDASSFTGRYTSKRWFYITSPGGKGFVHSSYVINQASVSNCSTKRGISAARWASEHVSVAKTTATERSTFKIPGATYWSGYCAGFQYSAYVLGAKVTPRYGDNAKPRYYAYKSAGLIKSMSSEPAIGAPVFYPNSTEWGHVAIYVGNGMVASTQGAFGTQANYRTKMKAGDFGTPSGWVDPNKV